MRNRTPDADLDTTPRPARLLTDVEGVETSGTDEPAIIGLKGPKTQPGR